MSRRATARAFRATPPSKILIVEDRESLRCAVEELVETDEELTVCAATESAEEALAALEGRGALHPDLAVVDISLPGMNGLELTARLRDLCPGMPVLILSSHPPEIYERPALAAGARAYLAKSRTATDLLAAIHRLLDPPYGGPGGGRGQGNVGGGGSGAGNGGGGAADPSTPLPAPTNIQDFTASVLRPRRAPARRYASSARR